MTDKNKKQMEIKKFLEDQGIAYGTNVDVYDEDSATWVGHSLAGLLSDFKDCIVKESDSLPLTHGKKLPLKIERIIAYVALKWGNDHGGATVGILGNDARKICKEYGIDWDNYR